LERLKHRKPYSTSAALVRSLLPDIKLRLSLGDGFKVEASIKKHLGLFRSFVLQREIDIANRILACAGPRAVLYDLGANIGLYTVLFARHPGRKVMSFEPGALALEYLRRNVALNALSNADIHPVLLSDRVGVRRFAVDNRTTAASHVAAEDEAAIPVECTDLDAYVTRMNLPPPDVVKIDVEGHEQEVIVGMKNLISQRHPTIFLEGGIRDGNGTIIAASLLAGMGYELWNLSRTGRVNADTPDYSFLAIRKAG